MNENKKKMLDIPLLGNVGSYLHFFLFFLECVAYKKRPFEKVVDSELQWNVFYFYCVFF